MEVALGITGKDYVLFASDTSANRSIVRMKADEDKQKVIGKHLVMACKWLPSLPSAAERVWDGRADDDDDDDDDSPDGDDDACPLANDGTPPADMGEPGDTVQFAEYVERNLRLYQIRNHIPLRPASAASWTRNQLAASIRSRKPYAVQLLLGGFDPTTSSPELFWIDLYGTLGTVPYAAHGYGAYFSLSTMDRWHSPDMDLAQGLDLLRKCVDELEKRFIVNLGTFTVRVADKDGVRQVDLKTGETIETI